MGIAQDADPTVRTYLRILRKRVWWIVAAALLGLTVSLSVALTSAKQYTATADVLVQPSASGSGSVAAVTPTDVQTDVQLVTSAPVESKVARALGAVPAVTATQVGQTNVIGITAVEGSPAFAARVANSYARAFVSYQQQVALTALTSAEARLSRQVKSLTAQITALRKRQGSAGQVTALVNQRAVDKQQLAQMEVGVTGAVGGVTLVTPAVAPVAPSSPKPVQDGALGLVAGLLGGGALTFLLESFEDGLGSKDLAEKFGGAPVLAIVPAIPSWKHREQTQVTALSQPLSPAAEAYRSLRTSVQFLRQERDLRVVVISSAAASEGKTATVANLGVTFAQAGERVLMVSADLRRPRLGAYFGADEKRRGITGLVRGEQSLSGAVQQIANMENLWMLGSGAVPANPAELLGSQRVRDLISRLRAEFDVIIIDSPPVLPVADAMVLAKYADAMMLVCSAARTKRLALRRAAEKLSQVNVPVVGLIMGEVTRQDGYGYGYGYGYKEAYGYGGYEQAAPERREAAAPWNGSGARVRPANGVVLTQNRRVGSPDGQSGPSWAG